MSSLQDSRSPSVHNASKRPAPRGTAAYPRKRAVTACQVCRSRRTKCDNQRPSCGFCSRTGAQCNYLAEGDDFSTYDAASLKILQRLDDIETLLRQKPNQSPITESIAIGPSADRSRQLTSSRNVDRLWLLPSSPDLLLTTFDKEVATTAHFLHSLTTTVASPQSESLTVTSPAVVVDLDPSSTRQLLDNFFNYVHVKNPILQEDDVRRMVSQLCLYGVDWTTESCLALLICALGSIATPFGDSHNVGPGSAAYITSHSYFRAAQRRLGNCLVKSGVLEAQCLFLAGVYHMCIFRPFDAWRLFSQSLSCCQGFSFLENQALVSQDVGSPEVSGASLGTQTAEQSVYWSAWKSESELRRNWNLPDFSNPGAAALYPPFFPTPPSPFRNGEVTGGNANDHRQETGWYFYLTEISLRRLVSRNTDDILRFAPRPGQDLIDGLAELLPGKISELETWTQALPEPMSLDTSLELDDVCKWVLRGHLIDANEMLYWPFLAYYIFDGLSDDQNSPKGGLVSRDILSDRFKALAETSLAWQVRRIQINKAGFHHRHHGTWLTIISCSRSVLMLLKAYHYNMSNPESLQLEMPDGWEQAMTDGLQLNEFWQQEAPDARRRHSILMSMIRDMQVPVFNPG